jgi:hypothetical protein
MTLRNGDNLKARVTKEPRKQSSRLENLGTCLKLVYIQEAKANKRANQKNKILYNPKAIVRVFYLAHLVYL